MKDNQIRQEVKAVLREMNLSGNYVSAGGNRFPYKDTNDIAKLPEDINHKEDYLINWEEVSDNQDVYDFPMKEFISGIQVEKAKRNTFSILDIAKIVINNLDGNPHFYSNLGI